MKYIRIFWPLYLICIIAVVIVAELGSRTVTTFADNMPIERSVVLVIDAGHGGEDGGATSCTGVLESRINLQIALRLNDLAHLLGFETVMIRTTDVSVYTEGNSIAAKKVSDLKQRVKIVNDIENAFLISIHQNTFPVGKYSGAQVFYNQHSGAKELAETMQSLFAQTVNQGSKRQCKTSDGIYLMQRIQRPGVLVECGFLTNPAEEANLRAGEYQKKLCCIMISAISTYLNA